MLPVPTRFKVVRTDRELEMEQLDARLRELGVELVVLPDAASAETLAAELVDADLLLMCYARITAPMLEGAFMLLMALFKRFVPIHAAVQAQGWIWPERRWLAQDLAGRTLGLVGLGRIGRSVARMAAAFKMQVLAYDPHAADVPAQVQRCPQLEPMLARADAVSIHCVLNDQTRHLIGAAQLARMKPTAVLVNVSRGQLVDETALLKALQEGRLAGAALDVYGQEPLSRQGHPLSALYAMDNVLLWPHLTFYTAQAMERLQAETLERCMEALQGQPLTVRSRDPRLRAQTRGVRLVEG